jgi:hypothetical protein
MHSNAAVEERTTCRVVVCFDPLGENDARQVASLLTHFRLEFPCCRLHQCLIRWTR